MPERISLASFLFVGLMTPSTSFLLAPAQLYKSFTASQLPSRAHVHTYATLKIHKIAAPLWCNKESSTETGQTLGPAVVFGLPRKHVAQPLLLLLLSQFILFVGVGAVIPTLPLYGKAIGLSSAVNGIVISAPAVALLIGARAAGEYAGMSLAPSGPLASLFFSHSSAHAQSHGARTLHLRDARSRPQTGNDYWNGADCGV